MTTDATTAMTETTATDTAVSLADRPKERWHHTMVTTVMRSHTTRHDGTDEETA